MLINVQFSKSDVQMEAKFIEHDLLLDAKFESFQKVTVQDGVKPYVGAYEVTPKVDAQTIPTAKKYMTDDMRINAIPFYETSNLSNGKTIYIGSEVEIYGD